MKLSPYSKALLAAYRDLKRAGKALDEIKEQVGQANFDALHEFHKRQEQIQLKRLEEMQQKEASHG